jgi:uncharacterized CHY-type Zn-finger protein
VTVHKLKAAPVAEAHPCPWCHEYYPCFKAEPKFTRHNCPRVDSMQFLAGEETRICPKTGAVLWDIQAVSFRTAEQLEVELPSIEDADEDAG